MILFITNTSCPTADVIMHLFNKRKIHVFRYNTDEYNKYSFLWNEDGFIFKDPCGRTIKSDDIDIVVMYKSLLSLRENHKFDFMGEDNVRYIEINVNYVTNALAQWASINNLLRLWPLREYHIPKTYQMFLAKKFFSVPKAEIHWGNTLKHKIVMFKTLAPFVTHDYQYTYVDKCDREQLSPDYPWFTQEIATGDRDATILYINGKIHCFQFAHRRERMTDWRVTQGTDQNQWLPWNPEIDFLKKVDLYMKDMRLKFGRLDFIIGGKEPEFLEVNPCGQFGWLDDEKLTLHNEVVDAILDSRTTITL
ncbi:MAG: hypothetical protein E7055_11765 [Lentisphaerae bacterium]|nr:hypothetical protein [Lentisphaerota bacterium]